jgi:hypothetical protein
MFKLEPQIKQPTKCQICGRTLTDPESIRQGAGPVCRGTSPRKRQENKQMSLDFDRPELIICMDTGNGWTGFSDKGEQVAYGKDLCDLAQDILSTYGALREKAMGQAFAEVIRGTTRGVVRQKVIEKFIKEWGVRNEIRAGDQGRTGTN